MKDLSQFLATAEEAARNGGRVLEEWAGKFTAREKSPANLVTEADLASEQAIYETIRSRYPDHGFLGEEGLSEDQGDSPYRWIIDPLDGTSNYVHRFPYYAVSIGLERAGELVLGVIYDPTRDEMYSAVTGGGANLNQKPISVSEIVELPQAMCMASLPIKADRNDVAIRRFLDMIQKAQTVQRTGSAALNLCAVACGRIEAFWSTSLKPWDMAAGVVIVREAGGIVTTCSDEDFSVYEPNLLATNGAPLHQNITEALCVASEPI
ncbi:inositol monophosphatase family protein [Thalassoglobus sp. JC818]|uniref:inositol monophosphatase family protein n=1 Tax=Thalassoglobus sp. JC818 TaxID=3232136 RepID=UPI003457DE89